MTTPAERPSDTVVHCVDDDASVRDSLVYLLESAGHAPRTYTSAEAFLESFDPGLPGCVIADVRLPGMDGIGLLRELATRGWRVPVVVLTGHGDIALAVEAMRSGAFDFLEKPVDDVKLVQTVAKAIEADARRRARYRERDAILDRLRRLTHREREVLERVVEGESTKEIASQFGTSFNTVQNQRASILRKMQARSVADLVRMVMITRAGEL